MSNIVLGEPDRVLLGKIVLERREKSLLSRREAARRAGMAVTTLERIEKGESTIDIIVLSKVCKAIDTDMVSILFQWETERAP